jgi:hypothetical protein
VPQNAGLGVRLHGTVGWDEVAQLGQRSYRMTAPKKLSARRWLGTSA